MKVIGNGSFMEEEPWYSILDNHLPPRTKNMTRVEGTVFLKRVIIKPFLQQLDWFFALYEDYKVLSDIIPTPMMLKGKYYPCAWVEVHYNCIKIYEYKLSFVLETEDADSMLIKAVGKFSKQHVEQLLVDCPGYKQLYDQYNGFIHPYPSLINGEKCTTITLLDDFAAQFASGMGACSGGLR